MPVLVDQERKIVVGVSLPPVVVTPIKREAKRLGLSQAEVLRGLIVEAVEKKWGLETNAAQG